MIRFSQLSLRRGAKVLLEGADASLNPGERVGLIGANGSGKTSLFALLRGELHADKGDADFPRHWRVAYVAQETPALDRPAVEYAIDGDAALRRLENNLVLAEEEDDGNLIGDLHAQLADADVYTVRSRAEQLLLGLGFSKQNLNEPVSTFSGGWRMRLNLAQALMCPSDLLLLDEPTNHLDLDAILWLEEWLKRYPGTLIVVSHDRDFLDGVVTAIVHIDQRKLRRYSGNYSSFERQRAQALVLAASQYEKQARERAHLQSFVDRFKAKATKARQAQSRMKMLEKMEDLAPLHVSAPFSFEFREPARAPNPLLVFEDVEAGYAGEGTVDTKVVLEEITFSLQSDQRIGLLGVNGAGKSTFIKTIAGALPPLAGSVVVNKGLEIGYFAQHQIEMLRDDQSPLWHLRNISEKAREQDLRDYLGGFNFPGDMATGSIEHFSGGEKARLALALIQPFDGDLDDYRQWLLNDVRPLKKESPKPELPRAAKPVSRKPIESRIKRLEEQMSRLNARKLEIESRLSGESIYGEDQKESLKELLLDQAYVGKELAQLESEWLDKQAELERGS